MSQQTQDHQFWIACEQAQEVIDNQLIELGIAHADKWGAKNESLNVDQRPAQVKKRVRAPRSDKMRVM